MINKIKVQLVILCISALMGCGTSKKAEVTPPPPQPEWVKNRPTSSTYYIGIGWARKTPDVNQYQQEAKKSAVSDMAGEISVNVSTNSVYHTLELNQNFREDFTSTIRTEIQQDLEGYELIDTYEDLTGYWVYYRLSKAEHQRLKEIKKTNAVSISLNLYGKAIDAIDAGNVKLALVNLVQALEPIKPYFSETIVVDFRGISIFLGNEIFGKLSSTLSAIEIKPVCSEVFTKMGRGLLQSQLEFVAKHQLLGPVPEILLIANYSEKPIRNNQKRTDINGKVAFEVDIIRTTKSFEVFTASLDIDAIILEATTDQFIRKLVNRLARPEGSIKVVIQKPVMHIISNESALGDKQSSGVLLEILKKKAIEAGYLVSENIAEADYIVRITATTTKQGENGAYKNIAMKGNISVETPKGDQLYHKPLDDIKGTHFDFKTASDEAYKEARRRIEITIFREINEAIKKR